MGSPSGDWAGRKETWRQVEDDLVSKIPAGVDRPLAVAEALDEALSLEWHFVCSAAAAVLKAAAEGAPTGDAPRDLALFAHEWGRCKVLSPGAGRAEALAWLASHLEAVPLATGERRAADAREFILARRSLPSPVASEVVLGAINSGFDIAAAMNQFQESMALLSSRAAARDETKEAVAAWQERSDELLGKFWDSAAAVMQERRGKGAMDPAVAALGSEVLAFAGEIMDADLGRQCTFIMAFLEATVRLRQADAKCEEGGSREERALSKEWADCAAGLMRLRSEHAGKAEESVAVSSGPFTIGHVPKFDGKFGVGESCGLLVEWASATLDAMVAHWRADLAETRELAGVGAPSGARAPAARTGARRPARSCSRAPTSRTWRPQATSSARCSSGTRSSRRRMWSGTSSGPTP